MRNWNLSTKISFYAELIGTGIYLRVKQMLWCSELSNSSYFRWFAKRFLHPAVVSAYDYIFLWDEDLGVENFHPGR